MRQGFFLFVLLLVSVFFTFAQEDAPPKQGELLSFDKKGNSLGLCPLKHTDVKAHISGFLSRVNVRQEFENNFSDPIEAVYTFPLSQNAAVDRMTMYIGDRIIQGQIKTREQARQIYNRAKNAGKTASLLDEERPNVFTQAVANILPNQKIIIEISYTETLKFEDSVYEFVFPMTVEERYFPDSVSQETVQKLSPPVDKRAGHDISMEVTINAGLPIQSIRAKSHEIDVSNQTANEVTVVLKNQNEIPNRDFVLQYDVSGKNISDAVLTHQIKTDGFFTLILQPPDKVANREITPKEIVFVLDTSGSMSGFPIEKAKESMALALKNLNPQDTFNLITFAGDTHILFEKPVYATPANLERAQDFLASREGGGGTEMMKAVVAALAPSDSQKHIRIVCFMTDGQIGNEPQIIGEIQKHPNARVFAFGIGDSVNRFLLDNMAKEGRGEVEYVSLSDDGSRAAKRFYQRVNTPLLTDISIDWNGMPVTDIYPKRIPDMFNAKPVIIYGRYTRGINGKITLRGKMVGKPFERQIDLNLAQSQNGNESLGTLWARTKIEDLMSQSYKYNSEEDEFTPKPQARIKKAVTDLGIQYQLMTQFTSFVAVEERKITKNGKTQTVRVPVYPASGTVYDEETGKRNGIGSGSADIVNSPANVVALDLTVNKGKANPTASPVPSSAIDETKPKEIKTVSVSLINDRAINLIQPEYPKAAKFNRASGEVKVEVLIDVNGNVISAQAISGNPLFKESAEKAAQQSKFSPTVISGEKVQVRGVIVYNYEIPKPTREGRLKEKVHFWLFDAYENKRQNLPAFENERLFIKDSKANIEILLTNKSPEVLSKLKSAGLEIISNSDSNSVAGRINLEKLAELAEIVEVQYIAPRILE